MVVVVVVVLKIPENKSKGRWSRCVENFAASLALVSWQWEVLFLAHTYAKKDTVSVLYSPVATPGTGTTPHTLIKRGGN